MLAAHDSGPGYQSHRHGATSPIVGPVVTDSGGLRLTNLPKGSTVMVDSKPLTESETRLPVGPHEVAISAPRYTFFTRHRGYRRGTGAGLRPGAGPDRTHRHTPKPAPAALDCTVPSPANRYGRACYDKPPLPTGPSRVPLTDDITGTPSPAVLLVKVSADGRTVIVQPNTPSNDAGLPEPGGRLCQESQVAAGGQERDTGRRLDPVRVLSFRTLTHPRCRISIRPRSWLRARWSWAT